MGITAITVCKGRLNHLRETLPTLTKLNFEQVVLVDADCPEHCGAWAEQYYPSVQVEKTAAGSPFNLSAARNLGARSANSKWLLFIDADVLPAIKLRNWMNKGLTPQSFYRDAPIGGVPPSGTAGTVILERRIFEVLGGYDDVIAGYGGEDDDLYARLYMSGLTPRYLPTGWGKAIEHDNVARTRFYTSDDIDTQRAVNITYVYVKNYLSRLLNPGETFSRPQREAIMEAARGAARNQKSGKLQLRLPPKSLTRLRSINMSLNITFEVN